MSTLKVEGIPSQFVARIRAGAPDANGQPAQVQIAEGLGNPCRHCLELIKPGDELLILAYRPFPDPQPYAEVGPIFVHRRSCQRYSASALPAWFSHFQPAIYRGYDHRHWIRYETGGVAPGDKLDEICQQLLNDPRTEYVHIRSKFNCFQCQVERA